MINVVILANDDPDKLTALRLDQPIALVPVNGKSSLERHLDAVELLNPKEVFICAGSLHAKQMIDFCSIKLRSHALSKALRIFIENDRRGTGGAVKYAMERAKNPQLPNLVINSDILTSESLSDFVASMPEAMQAHLMAVESNDISEYGAIEVNHRNEITSFIEKPGSSKRGLIHSGICIVNPSCSKFFIQGAFSLERSLFPRLSYASVFVSKSSWADLGTVEDFTIATKLFR